MVYDMKKQKNKKEFQATKVAASVFFTFNTQLTDF